MENVFIACLLCYHCLQWIEPILLLAYGDKKHWHEIKTKNLRQAVFGSREAVPQTSSHPPIYTPTTLIQIKIQYSLYKRGFVILNKSAIKYKPRCTSHLLFLFFLSFLSEINCSVCNQFCTVLKTGLKPVL